MAKTNIYKILTVSAKEFADELETIRQICQQYNGCEPPCDKSDTLVFFFYDLKSWKGFCEQIQLTVGNLIIKSSTKCATIGKEMKVTPDSIQPPQWFLPFQKQTLKFQEFVIQQFKKQDEFNKYISTRIDNLVKVNNLKE
jgi:hypothetical protein